MGVCFGNHYSPGTTIKLHRPMIARRLIVREVAIPDDHALIPPANGQRWR